MLYISDDTISSKVVLTGAGLDMKTSIEEKV